ncbi:hypothetical protein THAOC_24386, partial [Thalassiosira oceanica]
MQQLFDEKNNDDKLANKYNYSNVERYADKNVKLGGPSALSADVIFCPYNYDQEHWGLGVIYVQQKRIDWYDSLLSNMDETRRQKVAKLMSGL